MSYKMVAEETVKLDKITQSPAIVKALRGEFLDGDVIERYVEKYENAEPLPPLDVQKGTYVLIDGYHRLLALEKLGRQEARVKVWDVDDKGLLFFAYDRNDTHGVPITKKCRDRMIWTARHEYKLSQDDIAKRFHISRARVSQILNEDDVSNVNPNTNDDKRRKAYDLFEVLKAILAGDKTLAEIAKMFDVDPSRISQIKTEYHIEDMQTYAMIKAPQASLADLFKTAFLNDLLSSTSMNFTKNKIELRSFFSLYGTCGVVAEYSVPACLSAKMFDDYQINDLPFDCPYPTLYVPEKVTVGFRTSIRSLDILSKKTDRWTIAIIGRKEYQNGHLTETSVTLSDGHGAKWYDKYNEEVAVTSSEIERGSPDVSFPIRIDSPFLMPMSGEEGKLTLEVRGNTLKLKHNCKHGCECIRSQEIESFVDGKKGDAVASINYKDLTKVLPVLHGSIITLNFWKNWEVLLIKAKTDCFTKSVYLTHKEET